MTNPPVLHVCITCRGARSAGDSLRAGQALHDAVLARAAPGTVEVRAVQCLSVCGEGVAAALGSPGKWTYLLGKLGEDASDDLLALAAQHAEAPTGVVPKPRRPPGLAGAVIGRVPPLSSPDS